MNNLFTHFLIYWIWAICYTALSIFVSYYFLKKKQGTDNFFANMLISNGKKQLKKIKLWYNPFFWLSVFILFLFVSLAYAPMDITQAIVKFFGYRKYRRDDPWGVSPKNPITETENLHDIFNMNCEPNEPIINFGNNKPNEKIGFWGARIPLPDHELEDFKKMESDAKEHFLHSEENKYKPPLDGLADADDTDPMNGPDMRKNSNVIIISLNNTHKEAQRCRFLNASDIWDSQVSLKINDTYNTAINYSIGVDGDYSHTYLDWLTELFTQNKKLEVQRVFYCRGTTNKDIIIGNIDNGRPIVYNVLNSLPKDQSTTSENEHIPPILLQDIKPFILTRHHFFELGIHPGETIEIGLVCKKESAI